VAIDRQVTLPFGIYLAVLAASGHASRARKVVATVATRVGGPMQKKRFLAWAGSMIG